MSGSPVPFLARVPPPLLYAVAFFLGILLQRGLSRGVAPDVPGVVVAIGIGLSVAALLLALAAAGLLVRHRTTMVPWRESTTIVVQGPYRLTRNPMYVALTLGYLGIALWTRTWWALALLPVPVLLVDRFVIPMEEAQLRRRFGAVYEEYCGRVRRWL